MGSEQVALPVQSTGNVVAGIGASAPGSLAFAIGVLRRMASRCVKCTHCPCFGSHFLCVDAVFRIISLLLYFLAAASVFEDAPASPALGVGAGAADGAALTTGDAVV